MEQILVHGALRIKKKVVRAGDGKMPRKGDYMRVHYTGCFTNGQKFDSSRDRGQPFVFRVGVGQVIQGWDVALMTMSTSEHAVLTVPWQLAYGEAGFPPLIPERCDLVFDIHVIKIN